MTNVGCCRLQTTSTRRLAGLLIGHSSQNGWLQEGRRLTQVNLFTRDRIVAFVELVVVLTITHILGASPAACITIAAIVSDGNIGDAIAGVVSLTTASSNVSIGDDIAGAVTMTTLISDVSSTITSSSTGEVQAGIATLATAGSNVRIGDTIAGGDTPTAVRPNVSSILGDAIAGIVTVTTTRSNGSIDEAAFFAGVRSRPDKNVSRLPWRSVLRW